MRKSLFLVTLALALLCACSAMAVKSGNYEYTVQDDGTALITGYTKSETDFVIPAELDGHPVRVIPKGVFDNGSMKTLTISEGIVEVADSAFHACSSLEMVTLPKSLVTIGENPWRFCTKLTTIRVPQSNPAIATIDGVLYSKADRRMICYPKGKTGTAFTVPQGIQIIGMYAFGECSALTEIILPDSLKEIRECAFYACSGLKSMTLPQSVTIVTGNPWRECRNLKTLTLAGTNPVLGMIDGVLYDFPHSRLIACLPSMTSPTLTVLDGTKIIGKWACAECDFTKAVLPDSVTEIEDYAFDDCTKLTKINLPASVGAIGSRAFSGTNDVEMEVTADSYAQEFCKSYNYKYVLAQTADPYGDSTDWLNPDPAPDGGADPYGDSTDWLNPDPVPETTNVPTLWDLFH